MLPFVWAEVPESLSTGGAYPRPLGRAAGEGYFQLQFCFTIRRSSNVIQTALYQRWDSSLTSGLGPLNGPDQWAPNARVSFMAMWQDGIGRQVASANYGTNGNTSSLARPDSPPASGASVLVNQTLYNERGEAYITIDPAGKSFRVDSDDAGRQFLTTDNYVRPGPCETCGATGPCNCPLPPCSPLAPGGRGAGGEGVRLQPGNDQNVMVATTYNADDLILTLTAKNSVTGDQITRYEYGTTLADSGIARNDLLVATIYPDASDSADRVTFAYNRQSQKTSKTDQNGTTHGYSYDLLGRTTSDAVETLAPGIDDTILRIDTAYEIHGNVYQVTSYNAASGGGVVNQVQRAYNNFRQLSTEYQEHGGAVNTATSVKVQYAYANGSANTIRPTSVTYPNGRQLNYVHNAGNDDALSKVSALGDGSFATPVVYTTLVLGSFVWADYQEPSVRWDLIGGSCGGSFSSSSSSSSSSFSSS